MLNIQDLDCKLKILKRKTWQGEIQTREGYFLKWRKYASYKKIFTDHELKLSRPNNSAWKQTSCHRLESRHRLKSRRQSVQLQMSCTINQPLQEPRLWKPGAEGKNKRKTKIKSTDANIEKSMLTVYIRTTFMKYSVFTNATTNLLPVFSITVPVLTPYN